MSESSIFFYVKMLINAFIKQFARIKSGQQDARRNFYKSEIPRGGIYMLPPPQLELEERKGKAKPVSEKPTGPVVPGRLHTRTHTKRSQSCRALITWGEGPCFYVRFLQHFGTQATM